MFFLFLFFAAFFQGIFHSLTFSFFVFSFLVVVFLAFLNSIVPHLWPQDWLLSERLAVLFFNQLSKCLTIKWCEKEQKDTAPPTKKKWKARYLRRHFRGDKRRHILHMGTWHLTDKDKHFVLGWREIYNSITLTKSACNINVLLRGGIQNNKTKALHLKILYLQNELKHGHKWMTFLIKSCYLDI